MNPFEGESDRGIDIGSILPEWEQLIAVQRQFQTPEIAKAIAQKHGLELAVIERPFEQEAIMGDFYRLINRDGRLVIVLGDAVGHGEYAAPTVNAIHESLTLEVEQSIIDRSVQDDGSISMSKSIAILDEHLRNNKERLGLGFTGIPMVMVEVDQRQSVLRLANAGMEQAILLSNNKTAQLISPGEPLGISQELKAELSGPEEDVEKVISYQKGDILILMTDGVGADKGGLDQTNGMNVGSRLQEIKDFLKTPEASSLLPQQLVERISGFVHSPDDDITILAIQL